jgi:predicted ribosome quality control (RQC) complex YloA/Tae2 family protein
MELRKHLGRIDTVQQKGFDRILEIRSGEKTLVAEMFGKGNFILLDSGKIIGALRQEEWADRSVIVGENYEYPKPATDPREVDFFEEMEEGEIVRRIASDLSFGGVYAEEACARAEIDKNREISELDESERERVENAIREILSEAEQPSPGIYLDEEPVRVTPFPMESFGQFEFQKFESFSEALDEYFYTRTKEQQSRKQREAYKERKTGLEKQLEQQERKIEGLEKSSDENREKAELIYKRYQELEESVPCQTIPSTNPGRTGECTRRC